MTRIIPKKLFILSVAVLVLCVALSGCNKLRKKKIAGTWKCKGTCHLIFYRGTSTAPQRVDTSIAIETEVTISEGDSSVGVGWQMYDAYEPITYEHFYKSPFISYGADPNTGATSYRYKQYRSMVTDQGDLSFDGEHTIVFSYVYASPSHTERVELTGTR